MLYLLILTLKAGVFKIINSLSVDQIDRECARRPTIIFTQMTLERDVIEFHRATHEANLERGGNFCSKGVKEKKFKN